MNKTNVNEPVNITALYFRNKTQLKSFPKRMEYNGHEYTFQESGLAYRVVKKDLDLRFFNMTDGSADYRLRFDYKNLSWTLVSITRTLNFNN